VADAFDAMITDRVYRRGTTYEAALAEVKNCAGTHFDPVVVAAAAQIPLNDWAEMDHFSSPDSTASCACS
jgi:HD-GYP domain-containing protein (c-di-GMP phosphodiesterase class II)